MPRIGLLLAALAVTVLLSAHQADAMCESSYPCGANEGISNSLCRECRVAGRIALVEGLRVKMSLPDDAANGLTGVLESRLFFERSLYSKRRWRVSFSDKVVERMGCMEKSYNMYPYALTPIRCSVPTCKNGSKVSINGNEACPKHRTDPSMRFDSSTTIQPKHSVNLDAPNPFAAVQAQSYTPAINSEIKRLSVGGRGGQPPKREVTSSAHAAELGRHAMWQFVPKPKSNAGSTSPMPKPNIPRPPIEGRINESEFRNPQNWERDSRHRNSNWYKYKPTGTWLFRGKVGGQVCYWSQSKDMLYKNNMWITQRGTDNYTWNGHNWIKA